MCNIEFIQEISLFPFGFPIISINIILKARKPLAITSHFIKFKRKSLGLKFSFSNFFEEVYVIYVNEQKINKSNKSKNKYPSFSLSSEIYGGVSLFVILVKLLLIKKILLNTI